MWTILYGQYVLILLVESFEILTIYRYPRINADASSMTILLFSVVQMWFIFTRNFV